MDSEYITPFDVEQEMVDLNTRIGKAPGVIKAHHNALKEARTAHRMAYARAYSTAEGTILDRRMQADLETQGEREAMDNAEITYRYVRDELDALKTKLRALQSIGSMLRAEMFNKQGGL